MDNRKPYRHHPEKTALSLYSPNLLPKASGYLWNREMLLHMNCRGYATAQFMQPEPAKYSHAPNLEAQTFMQPEQPFYSDHPGRFFYVKSHHDDTFFSVPYEPLRCPLSSFEFIVAESRISWVVKQGGFKIDLQVELAEEDVVEKWQFTITNLYDQEREVTVFPYFTIGYMSWMNQSATFDDSLTAIIASSIAPYQQLNDYQKQRYYKDKTYLLADTQPSSWEANFQQFVGEGGLTNPESIQSNLLKRNNACYELPVAVLQYDLVLKPGDSTCLRFLFGPAETKKEIARIREKYFKHDKPPATKLPGENVEIDHQIVIQTPDQDFDHFVNRWLPRQLRYHGDSNRFTTDPQTRNYLQDNMGLVYLNPRKTRRAILNTLSQQRSDGALPDGVLLHRDAALKYINQIPHADHATWLPICLQAYLSETNDISILAEKVGYSDTGRRETVFEHINQAMLWLDDNRDERGLSLIHQGDWCDPMNMVGHKGKGVSSWLTMATAYAYRIWADVCHLVEKEALSNFYQNRVSELNQLSNQHFWFNGWYARGITDDGRLFGTGLDSAGQIFLNPQSWSILSGALSKERREFIFNAIDCKLNTPFGMMILAPAYTRMERDIGRLTQKYPGTAENGSVYNHAAAFFAYALYQCDQPQRAFDVLRKMIPDHHDCIQRGQLPVFIPNYYRGACDLLPEQAGRSSQLLNTGTVAWFYRMVIEELFGLKGNSGQLVINPKLPEKWSRAKIVRFFAGAKFSVEYERKADLLEAELWVDGIRQHNWNIEPVNKYYAIKINLPT